jgi:hypothetical protein
VFKKVLGIIVFITILIGVLPASQTEARAAGHGKVYMFVINGLSISDLSETDTPFLARLARKGALGLASNRTLRGTNSDDGSLTIGAGNLARAYTNGIMGFNSDEVIPSRDQTAAHLYQNLTGFKPGESASLMVNLPEILTKMADEKVNTVPGSLGEALRRNNLKVCVLGNGDINDKPYRSSIAIGMDAEGRVPLGDIGPRTTRNTTSSYLGRETDYDYLRSQAESYHNKADLMIIELSDLARLEEADVPFAPIGEAHKKRYLRKIDQLVQQVSKQTSPDDMIMVISSAPAQFQVKNKNTFTPVIIYGPGYSQGYITSGATRRDYIVASTDLAPTILKFFGILSNNHTMIGQPILTKAANGTDTIAAANNISNSAATVNRLRVPLVKGYVFLQILILALSMIAIFWIYRLMPIVEPLVVGLVTAPLVMLPLGKLHLAFDWEYILAAILITIGLTAALLYAFKKDAFKAFVTLCIMTVLMINLDLFTGSTMISSSVLGYDAMAGARYYGIGNEYIGILIGSTIIIATVLYEKFNQRWFLAPIGIVLLAECYVIAGPSLGASSDGVITAPFAYLVTLALLSNIRISPRAILAAASVILAAILGLTIYDLSRPAELQTHIGRAANQILMGGWQEGFTIITRKLGMNVKLIKYTIWSRVFLVMLVVLALLVYRPVGALCRLRQERPMIIKGFAGIISAALVGLIINDSGIVAAATTSIYIVVPLLLLVLDLQKKRLAV